jgi:hypothetical protein
MKCPKQRTSPPRWGAANVARLGTAADYLIAEILRFPTAEVRAQRESRGIPKFGGRHGAKHAWTPGDRDLLGTMADAAERLGTSVLQVETERNRVGIPAFVLQVQQHTWLPEHDAMLGVKFDSELAAMLGVKTDSEVAALLGINRHIAEARRNKLGIPRQYSNRKITPP